MLRIKRKIAITMALGIFLSIGLFLFLGDSQKQMKSADRTLSIDEKYSGFSKNTNLRVIYIGKKQNIEKTELIKNFQAIAFKENKYLARYHLKTPNEENLDIEFKINKEKDIFSVNISGFAPRSTAEISVNDTIYLTPTPMDWAGQINTGRLHTSFNNRNVICLHINKEQKLCHVTSPNIGQVTS